MEFILENSGWVFGIALLVVLIKPIFGSFGAFLEAFLCSLAPTRAVFEQGNEEMVRVNKLKFKIGIWILTGVASGFVVHLIVDQLRRLIAT